MPTVSQPYGGRMSPSQPVDAQGTLPNRAACRAQSTSRMSPPGILATRLARGAVVQLRHRCPRVKRDGTAGLVGCVGQTAAEGGPHPAGEFGRLPRSRLTGTTATPPATGYGRWPGEGTRLRRVLLRWQAPQPCRSRPGSHRGRGRRPYASGYASPYAGHPRTPPVRMPASVQVMPYGGVERPRRKVRFARLIHRRGRVLGVPSARAACGGNPALTDCHAEW